MLALGAPVRTRGKVLRPTFLGRYRCFAPWEEIPRLMQLLLSFVNSDEVARPPRPAAQAKQQ